MNNVLTTVSDKVTYDNGYYMANVISANDYYPFGWTMPNRKLASDKYRYGFNGMEKDDELKGEGNSYDFGARLYDSRVGRWLSVDLLHNHSSQIDKSPYISFWNNPIYHTDPDGRLPGNPIKAFWGALNEWGEQAYKNYREGKTGFSIIADVDINDIVIEAVDGYLNDAIPDAVKEVYKESVDLKYDSKKGFSYKADISLEKIKDGLLSYGVNKVSDATMGKINNIPNTTRKLKNKSKRLDNIAKTGRKRKSQISRAKKARKKAYVSEGLSDLTSPVRSFINSNIGGAVIAAEVDIAIKDPLKKNSTFMPNTSTSIITLTEDVFAKDGFLYKANRPLYTLSSGNLADAENFEKAEGHKPKPEDQTKYKPKK